MQEAELMEIEPAVKHGDSHAIAQNKMKPSMDKPTSLMWIEKYRPQGLNDLLSHQEIIATLRTLISNNRLPHLLFCGPPGTGKTSTILACAKEMYGSSFKSMVLELNASDDRGIGVVRDQIKSFASTKRIFSSGVKLIVLDEADAMTTAAQMALRRVVEKYAANTRFCIICNYVNKIIPALQSRCTKFRFGPLPADDVRKRVLEIAALESVSISSDGLEALLTLGKGDMRRILNVLQSTHLASSGAQGGEITADAVYSNTGAPHPGDVKAAWGWLLERTFPDSGVKLRTLMQDKGLALGDIITELFPLVSTSSLSKNAKMYMFESLSDIEYRMATGSLEKLNMAALIGCCKFASAMNTGSFSL